MATLGELAAQVVKKREERGFVTDPLKLHVLLTEEMGEVAAELKRTWSVNYESFSKERLAEEIADSFCLLVALADRFGIDIESRYRLPEAKRTTHSLPRSHIASQPTLRFTCVRPGRGTGEGP